MDSFLVAIILFCICGSGITCYLFGHKNGIKDSVDFLVNEGMIEVDPD